MDRRTAFTVLVALGIAACGESQAPVDDNSLPALGANGRVSVAGISSGGYMAGQYQVAYADEIHGAALVAAGPWACANGSVSTALGPCVSGDGIEVGALTARASEMAAAGNISSTNAMADHQVVLFSAADDVIVSKSTVAAAASWLDAFVPQENVMQIDEVPGVHGWLTDGYGVDCQSFESPYINNCGYDLAGEILGHWYGELEPADEASGSVFEFDQSAFGDASLTDLGYVFVPEACADGPGCDVVVFFHGCQQSSEVIGRELAENSGFNRWAASNSTIVLYPQVQSSSMAPMNPLGCWDWWGYSGDDYLSKSAPQLAAVHGMVERLAATE